MTNLNKIVFITTKIFKNMENKNLNDQKMIEETAIEQPKKVKKIFGVPVKTLLWVLFGIGTAVGGYYAVSKYKSGKKNNTSTSTANEEVDVNQPQEVEESSASQENKNDRYHNNGYRKNGRWNNNTNN